MTRTAAPAWAGTEAETETKPGRTEATAETGTERAVVPGVVTAEVFAKLAAGLVALFMQRALLLRMETEAQRLGAPRKAAAEWGEWMVHGLSRFWMGNAACATDR